MISVMEMKVQIDYEWHPENFRTIIAVTGRIDLEGHTIFKVDLPIEEVDYTYDDNDHFKRLTLEAFASRMLKVLDES